MVVSITLFYSLLFLLIQFYVVLIILWFAIRLIGWPLKLFFQSIYSLIP